MSQIEAAGLKINGGTLEQIIGQKLKPTSSYGVEHPMHGPERYINMIWKNQRERLKAVKVVR